VVLNPRLTLHGHDASLDLIQKGSFQIRTIDSEGVENSKDIDSVKLVDGEEFVATFQVPENLR